MGKKSSNIKTEVAETLPQNVFFVGEHVEEDKHIYISQTVYKNIHKFTKDKTQNESGGILVGDVIDALGKTNIIINGFIETKHEESTPTTLKFTHETWDYIHKKITKEYPEKKILGWIHTHPNFGVFLSDYDKFVHKNFFKGDHEIAYVVDPVRHIEGFYFWIDGELERCKGFFIFDRVGKKIEVTGSTSNEKSEHLGFFARWQNILIVVLLLVSIILGFSTFELRKQVTRISRDLTTIKVLNESTINAVNTNFGIFDSRLKDIEGRITAIENGDKGILPSEDGLEKPTENFYDEQNAENKTKETN